MDSTKHNSTIFHPNFRCSYKFFEYFKNNTEYNNDKSILDIGTTPSLDEEQNVILTKTIDNKNITCISNQDCQILSKNTPT